MLTATAVLLLTACSGTTPAPGSPDSGLVDRAFVSTMIVGRDLAPDTRITLTFGRDGQLGATGGCNTMGGTWSLDGTTLRAQMGAMTEMACDPARMAQDDWLGDYLSGGLSATLDGNDLVLAGSGVTLTLLDTKVANPDQPLEGTTWILSGIQTGAGGDAVVSSAPAGVRSTIRLADGRMDVDTGCNAGAADVTVDGMTIAMGPMILTKRGCEPDPTEVERAMSAALAGDLQVEIDGSSLRLVGPRGGLHFEAE